MLDFLFKSNKSTSFYTLYKKIVKWRESNVYPFSYNLPSTISFPEDFWKDILRIYKETKSDGLERAISLFWADNELVVTSTVIGDEKSVKSSHSVNVRYEKHPTKKEYLRKLVTMDGKTIKKRDIYYKKVPKKISVEYLFNMHTHPSHKGQDGSLSYNFFSVQDIRSLISSKAIITGLVTDRLWLLVRTSDTPNTVALSDESISVESLKEEMMFGVYVADFKKKAVKQ